jgi:protein-S-isoprenylcysteine O-methyltransferase Ste14
LRFTAFTWRGPATERQRDSLFSFGKTATLVTAGAYRYIPEPLYGSLVFLTREIFFKHAIVATVVVALAAGGFLAATARPDKAGCVGFFGQSYDPYMKQTKIFIPFII